VSPELALTPLDLEFDHGPPCFFAAGTRDRLMRSSELAYAELLARGLKVRLELYEDEQHGFFNTTWRDASSRLRDDIVDFLDQL